MARLDFAELGGFIPTKFICTTQIPAGNHAVCELHRFLQPLLRWRRWTAELGSELGSREKFQTIRPSPKRQLRQANTPCNRYPSCPAPDCVLCARRKMPFIFRPTCSIHR